MNHESFLNLLNAYPAGREWQIAVHGPEAGRTTRRILLVSSVACFPTPDFVGTKHHAVLEFANPPESSERKAKPYRKWLGEWLSGQDVGSTGSGNPSDKRHGQDEANLTNRATRDEKG